MVEDLQIDKDKERLIGKQLMAVNVILKENEKFISSVDMNDISEWMDEPETMVQDIFDCIYQLQDREIMWRVIKKELEKKYNISSEFLIYLSYYVIGFYEGYFSSCLKMEEAIESPVNDELLDIKMKKFSWKETSNIIYKEKEKEYIQEYKFFDKDLFEFICKEIFISYVEIYISTVDEALEMFDIDIVKAMLNDKSRMEEYFIYKKIREWIM